jgi:hypothetical protein
MTNDKDSAVLAPCPFCGGEAEVQQQGTNRQSHIIACTNCGCRLETGETWNAGSLWNKRQPTQSDAVLEGDALPILYLLGVKHGQEDERAKIAAEASQPTQSNALRDLVAALYCASGCSCCRDDDAWEKASDELGQLFNIPKYKNGYGYDWHSVHEAALQEQSK